MSAVQLRIVDKQSKTEDTEAPTVAKATPRKSAKSPPSDSVGTPAKKPKAKTKVISTPKQDPAQRKSTAKKSTAKVTKREASARDLMNPAPVRCRADDTLNEAARLMWEHDVGCIVVVGDRAEPISLLTDRDMAMAAYTQGVALYHGQVASAMAKRLITCHLDTSVAEIRELMAEAQVRRLPVVDDAGKLVGIVGLRDILEEAQDKLPSDRKRGSTGPMLVQLVSAIVS